jgi:hypothetical protein
VIFSKGARRAETLPPSLLSFDKKALFLFAAALSNARSRRYLLSLLSALLKRCTARGDIAIIFALF